MATTSKTTKAAAPKAATPTPAPAVKTSAPAKDFSADIAELTAQLSALSKEVASLKTELNEVAARKPAQVPGNPAVVDNSEITDLKNNLKRALKKMGARDHMVNHF